MYIRKPKIRLVAIPMSIVALKVVRGTAVS